MKLNIILALFFTATLYAQCPPPPHWKELPGTVTVTEVHGPSMYYSIDFAGEDGGRIQRDRERGDLLVWTDSNGAEVGSASTLVDTGEGEEDRPDSEGLKFDRLNMNILDCTREVRIAHIMGYKQWTESPLWEKDTMSYTFA